MSTRNIVWVNKRKPMPKWLAEGEARERQRYDISFRYWLKIWYATPLWANYEAVKAIYLEATQRRAAGELVHVDHQVPLKHPYVCGLHCEANLKIITEAENYAKSNHTWPGRWEDQYELEFDG